MRSSRLKRTDHSLLCRGTLLPVCVGFLFGYWRPAVAGQKPFVREPPKAGLYLHMSWSKPQAALKAVIPGARALGYDSLVLEIGGNVVLEAQGGLGAAWSKAEVRELLELARANDLEVIPCASLLGHAECTPRSEEFRDGKLGMRLWEPGAYEFIEAYVAEVCALFGRPRYFHARMDESRPLIAECSNRLEVTPAEFLADHINRVNAIVQGQNARLIVYHDMLLPAEKIGIGTALGGEPLNCWEALDDLSREVIINFWLYQFSHAHGHAVEFFTSRGFETWLSPWLTPEPMCTWAAERGLPLIQTTWCNVTSLAHYEANLRAVVLGAAYRQDPDLPGRYALPFDPLLKAVQAFNRAKPGPEGRVVQLALPRQEAGIQAPARIDVPERVRFAGTQWKLEPLVFHDPRETFDDRLEEAAPPLKVVRADGVERSVDGVNRGRGEAHVTLYTPAFGHHPATNMYGGEVSIIDGIVQDRAGDVWSGSGLVIPRGGCLLSGHCSGDVPGFLSKIGTHQTVRLVDANGVDLFSAPLDDTTLLGGVVVPVTSTGSVREVWILHATLNEMALRPAKPRAVRPVVGEVLAETANGPQRFEIRFRREVASWHMARWLLDDEGRPAEDVRLCWAGDRGYGDVSCLWATRLKLDTPQRLVSLRLKPTTAGAAAGWIVAAVGLGG